MIADWEVAKTQGLCAGCQHSFEPKQDYYAVLAEVTSPSGGFQRLDYCQECWQRNQPKVFCFWKTSVPEPTQKQKLLVDDEVLLDFFQRLDGSDEPSKINFRFVLALILMRKRILKYQQTDLRDGKEFWIMGQVRQDTTHEVPNPQLDDASIEEVSEQLSAVLRSEL